MTFFQKLTAAAQRNQSLLCVGLDPNPAQIPQRYRQSTQDEAAAMLAWNRAVIEQTADKVCAFKPNIAFYEALGSAGMHLLRQTLDVIPAQIPVILDVKRGDMGNTAVAYAKACFEVWGVDAVTLSPYLGRDSIDPFAAYPGKGLFVLCHTSNPSAQNFQTLDILDSISTPQPLYHAVARQATSWSPNVGLVVGATYPQALAEVRTLAPDVWFLVPGIGAQGGDLAATLHAGLRRDGLGLIISASRSISQADDPAAAAESLRSQIASAQSAVASGQRPIHTTQSPTHHSLPADLADLNAIQFGDFTLASGIQSPFYIDLRLLVSAPRVLAQAARAYGEILATLECERIAGVPYAALPIGTALSLVSGTPLIYPRKEVKAYGLGKDIEGAWQPGDRVVMIEDLITSGGSIVQSAERLRAAGLVVEHAIVLIDREQGGVEKLAATGITAHSVFKLTTLLEQLVHAGKLSGEKQQEVLAFVRGS